MAKNAKPGRMTFRNMMITSIIGALTFAVAFAWKDAIQASFDVLFPPQDALTSKWLAAFLITAAVVVIAFMLYKVRDIASDVVRGVRREVQRSTKRRKRR